MSMNGVKSTVVELLRRAEISVDGTRPHDIRVNDDRFYGRVLSEGTLGLGESYMDGWWDCEALDLFIARLLRARIHEIVRGNWKFVLHYLKSRLINLQSSSRAFEVGQRHYDIGNDLYSRMLGQSMAYTCAYWKNASTLDEAQKAKFDLVCRKTGLVPGMRVLELGCGFGGFARHAAANYGVEVTGYTVSSAQVEFGRELCKGLPVELRLADYREACGEYDAVISIGIMEHVGFKNYRTYMELAHRCLKKDAIAFIHTIGNNARTTVIEPWVHKHIFPNAQLPCMSQMSSAMERLFIIEDVHNIGPDYDTTLMAWNRNFEAAWPELKDRYGERFRRMWRYYLMSCAAGFRVRYTQLWQFVMTRCRDGRVQPECRSF